MREKHPLGRRLLALTAAICTLGSLAVVPAANAEGGKTPAAPAAAAACTPVDTQKNKDSFKLGSDGQGTVVEGFSDKLLASKAACYDVNVSADVSRIADSAFKGQPIGKLTFDEGNVPLSIGANAFEGVTVLKTLAFPARLTAIGVSSFQDIASLETVDFGASKVEKIPESAFISDYGASSSKLSTVKLPVKLNEIGHNAFYARFSSSSHLTVIWPTDSDTLRIDYFAFWNRHIANDTFDFTRTKLQSVFLDDNIVWGFNNTVFKVVFPSQMKALSIGDVFNGGDLNITLPKEVEDLELSRLSIGMGSTKPVLLRLPEKITGRTYLSSPLLQRVGNSNNGTSVYQAPAGVTADSDYWDHVYFDYVKSDKYYAIQDSTGKHIDASAIKNGHNVRLYMRSQDDASRTFYKEVPFIDVDDSNSLNSSDRALVEAPEALSRKGYTFKGWIIKGDFPTFPPFFATDLSSPNPDEWCSLVSGSAVSGVYSCRPGQKIAVYAGEYTWTAQWEKAPAATEVTPEEPKQSADDGTVTIPSVTGVNYSYVKDGKTVQVQPGEKIVLRSGETVTVTAAPASGYRFPANARKEWTFSNTPVPPAGKKFTVTFDSQGGSPVASQTVEEGKPVAKPANPTRDGYTFRGWTADPEGASDYDFTAKVNESFILYARWQKDAPVVPNPPDNGGNNGGSGNNGNTGNNGGNGGTTTPSATIVDVERFYNPWSGEHFYTASATEQSVLRSAGWRDEGVAFRMSSDKGTPVYRVYNPGAKHLFTTSAKERDVLIKAGWRDEGIAFYVPDGAKTDVHRLYNPGNGDHLLTTSANERGVVLMHKWRDEGIAFKAQ